jgi:hypothetical protein
MADVTGAGSLKCVSASSRSGPLRDEVGRVLASHAGAQNVRHLHDGVFLVYTSAEPAAVRDWLAARLEQDGSVFVAEFERWSARGPAVDAAWLLRRGH